MSDTTEVYDFDAMSRKELIQALKNELADIGILVQHLTKIYDYASGGKVTKPMTLPEVVIALSEDRENTDAESAVKEETAHLEARIIALQNALFLARSSR